MIKRGCAISPTIISDAARPQSRVVDGERKEGVLKTEKMTNRFPAMDNNMNVRLIPMIAGLEWSSSRERENDCAISCVRKVPFIVLRFLVHKRNNFR